MSLRRVSGKIARCMMTATAEAPPVVSACSGRKVRVTLVSDTA